jgi:hypothetical protein
VLSLMRGLVEWISRELLPSSKRFQTFIEGLGEDMQALRSDTSTLNNKENTIALLHITYMVTQKPKPVKTLLIISNQHQRMPNVTGCQYY